MQNGFDRIAELLVPLLACESSATPESAVRSSQEEPPSKISKTQSKRTPKQAA